MAAYNGMSWIEEQLSSILAQTRVRVSVYISVDPSLDGTEAWCAEFARTHAQVHLLPPCGPFGGAARNFFRLIRDVDFSGFDYISFSDQDDIWYPEKLERATAKIQSCNIDGYSSNVVAFWQDGRRMVVDKAQPQVKWDYLFEAAGPGCTYVLSKELASAFKAEIKGHWEEVQEVALHDWYCYAFARSNGFKWFIDPAPGMDYRQHAKNQVGVNAGAASAMMRLKRVAQGWWLSQVRVICSLTSSGRGAVCPVPELSRRVSLLWLAVNSRECRRRNRDRVAFSMLCIYMALFNKLGS